MKVASLAASLLIVGLLAGCDRLDTTQAAPAPLVGYDTSDSQNQSGAVWTIPSPARSIYSVPISSTDNLILTDFSCDDPSYRANGYMDLAVQPISGTANSLEEAQAVRKGCWKVVGPDSTFVDVWYAKKDGSRSSRMIPVEKFNIVGSQPDLASVRPFMSHDEYEE